MTTTAENETAFVNTETLARRWKGDRVRGPWTAHRWRARSVQMYMLWDGDNT